MMHDRRNLAETLNFWLRIQRQNWEDGFPPSPSEASWIRCAMEAARDGGSLDRMQDCILHAILKDRSPPGRTPTYSLDAFRQDLGLFQTQYVERH